MRIISKIILMILLNNTVFFIIGSTQSVVASMADFETRQKTVVRVGWYNQGFHMDKKNGEYTGFSRAYIDKLAEYADFKYVFVEGELEDLYQSLLDGEIDIIPMLWKSSGRMKDIYFATESVYETLYMYTQKNNPLAGEVLEEFNGRKIGYTNEEQLHILQEYASLEGLKFKYVPFDRADELSVAFRNAELDLVLTDELFLESDQILVDKITNGEMALAVSKQRKDILNQVNKALIQIEQENPHFTNLLEYEYVKKENVQFYLSPNEAEIIQNINPLNVVIDDNGVYQTYNSSTGKFQGIAIDVMNKISEITGIEFQYVSVNADKLLEGGVDLIGSVDKNMDKVSGNGYRLTTPYMDANLVTLRKINNSPINDEDERDVGVFYKLSPLYKKAKVYMQLEDMFSDFTKGNVDELVITSLNADYYIRKFGLERVGRIPYNGEMFRNCMAVKSSLPPEILTVLNRAILSIGQNEIHEIIASDSVFNERSFSSVIKEYPHVILGFSISTVGIFSILFCVIIIRDRKHKKELIQLAKQDPMTKLWNKVAIKEEIISTLNANKAEQKYALAIFDIDYFKSINDTYGHAVGDAAIVHFANLLREYFSANGLIGRMGGDEFIILMNMSDEAAIKSKIEHFLNSAAFTFKSNDIVLTISTSIGISVYPDHGRSARELYDVADEALYEVKRSGRGTYCMSERCSNLTKNVRGGG